MCFNLIKLNLVRKLSGLWTENNGSALQKAFEPPEKRAFPVENFFWSSCTALENYVGFMMEMLEKQMLIWWSKQK